MVLTTDANIVRIGNTTYLLLPEEIKTDSQFPFSLEDDLTLKIEKEKLVVEKTQRRPKK